MTPEQKVTKNAASLLINFIIFITSSRLNIHWYIIYNTYLWLREKRYIHIQNNLVVTLYTRCWWCYQQRSPQHHKWKLFEVFLLLPWWFLLLSVHEWDIVDLLLISIFGSNVFWLDPLNKIKYCWLVDYICVVDVSDFFPSLIHGWKYYFCQIIHNTVIWCCSWFIKSKKFAM